MDEASVRIPVQTSNAELDRRWSAVRREMKQRGIDVLVMQNTNQWLGGYVKWFTDVPAANGYPMTVLFEADDEMTVINSGPRMDREWGMDLSARDWSFRGVKNRLTAPYFPSLNYSSVYDAELVVEHFASRPTATIGWIALGHIPAPFYEHIRKNLPRATLVDASDFVDEIKAIKSAEEIGLIRRCAALQDAAMAHALKTVAPGMRDNELVAHVQQYLEIGGSEEQLLMCGSAPPGQQASILKRHFMNRKIEKGDQIALLIESNGPGGYYTELGRIMVVGKAPSELLDSCAVAKAAQHEVLKNIKAGASPRELIDVLNVFLKKNGYPEERRLFAHGQGYDMVERPAIRADEPMLLKADMNITCHPIAATKSAFGWICDNYLVTPTGVSECLHKTDKRIFEV
jgi:Xaa-Pro aminopeptidase